MIFIAYRNYLIVLLFKRTSVEIPILPLNVRLYHLTIPSLSTCIHVTNCSIAGIYLSSLLLMEVSNVTDV